MDRKVVRYDVRDGVAVVTLDRSERLNAWTARMEAEYRWCLDTADADPDVACIVVTGAGRGFCAGADARALEKVVEVGDYGEAFGAEQHPIPARGRPELRGRFSFQLGLSTPVLAAVNGPAAGAGFVLACFADLRFASTTARFTTSSGRLGLPAELGVSWILPRLVGPGHAADLLFSSRIVDADEARAIGLVQRVVEPDDLLPEAIAYGRVLATEISPSSLATSKRQLWEGLLDPPDVVDAEADRLLQRMTAEPDFAEGAAALREKRLPRFERRPDN